MREKLNNRNRQSGFTIIEVVLVLAIAGLIFLIVFLALPQLQKSRRDTQRKSDAGRALSSLESYAGNNNGGYPTDDAAGWNAFVGAYLTNGGVFQDPTTGTTYGFTAAQPTAAGQIRYSDQSVCGAGGAVTGTTNARDIAVVVYQESGGVSCQDNR